MGTQAVGGGWVRRTRRGLLAIGREEIVDKNRKLLRRDLRAGIDHGIHQIAIFVCSFEVIVGNGIRGVAIRAGALKDGCA